MEKMYWGIPKVKNTLTRDFFIYGESHWQENFKLLHVFALFNHYVAANASMHPAQFADLISFLKGFVTTNKGVSPRTAFSSCWGKKMESLGQSE